jgi:hypothetical protein
MGEVREVTIGELREALAADEEFDGNVSQEHYDSIRDAAQAWLKSHENRIWVYRTSLMSGVFARCNPEDAEGYVVLNDESKET